MGKSAKQRKRGAGQGEDAAANDEPGGDCTEADADAGLCPCALELKVGELQRMLDRNALRRGLCEDCERTPQAAPAPKNARGKDIKAAAQSRLKRGAKSQNAAPAPLPPPAICLSCGACCCLKQSHAQRHCKDATAGKTKKAKSHTLSKSHTLFLLPTGRSSAARGYCVHCSVPVALRLPSTPSGDFGEDEEGGYAAVDDRGYLLDDTDARERFEQCSELVLSLFGAANSSFDPSWLADYAEGGGNKKKKKHKKGFSQGGGRRGRGVSEQALSVGLHGLQNFGNTCFFNATVQCVAATPGLSLGSGGVAGALSAAAHALLLKMRTSGGGGVLAQLRGLLGALRQASPMFQGGGQHDAQECLRFMFGRIELECVAAAQKKGEPAAAAPQSSPLLAAYGGKLGSKVTCGTCGCCTETPEDCYDLSVPLHRSVAAAVASFFVPEPLGKDSYLCAVCNKAAYEAKVREKEEARQREVAAQTARQAEERVDLAKLLSEEASDDEGDGSGEEDEEEDEEGDGDDDEQGQAASSGAPTPPRTPPAAAARTGRHVDPAAGAAAPAPAAAAEGKGPSERPEKEAKVYTTAHKEYVVRAAPRVLAVHLKRFVASVRRGSYRYEKDDSAVDISTELTLNVVPRPEAPPAGEAAGPAPEVPPAEEAADAAPGAAEEPSAHTARYKLFAVVEHWGSIGGGHYVARVRKEHDWFQCNDSYITSCSGLSGCAESAYMLFYERRD
eukprot:TRINITY_DN21429_c0_g3_i1.p1 TRINITY_DN21429_c0_g3~~TRINITY_DN21429_c0_g3_i1.p1  ORF type:complete len:761 (+),score=236.49 TRINITY_DN21429_c0_g3_i1:98-2284(+)